MLNDINDLFELEQRINEIESKRGQLAEDLQKYRDALSARTQEQSHLDHLADQIMESQNNWDAIQNLKLNYGELQILNELESQLEDEQLKSGVVTALKELEPRLDELIAREQSGECDDVNVVVTLYEDLSRALNGLDPSIDDYSQYIFFKFEDDLVKKIIKRKESLFNEELFKTYWDNQKKHTLTENQRGELRGKSSELFRLSKCILMDSDRTLWNFRSISNNFRVRFTYHFHNSTTNIETYFKFLNDYLQENLYHCISIFNDEESGVTKSLIHEQFIDHVLDPIRDKIRTTLSTNDLKTSILLISQVLATDKVLSKTFHYRGNGLASLVTDELWGQWITYEEEITKRQFESISGSTDKDLLHSGTNFHELIKKTYEYLEPLLTLEYPPAQKFKLLCSSNIFLNLFSKFLDYILHVDTLGEHKTKEEELQQTLVKLNNLSFVLNKMNELSGKESFILLTSIVNLNEGKSYVSLFQDIQKDYEYNMKVDIQNSIVYRIQKLLKETLRNYFKITGWSYDSEEEEVLKPSPELVNSINFLTRIFTKLDAHQIPTNITLKVKNDVLSQLVHYFVESILKLNKFNERGLEQFKYDFYHLKECLNLPEGNRNSDEKKLNEILTLLKLRYDPDASHFYQTSFIKSGNFRDLRNYKLINILKDTDIQDALYRIAYGNIIE
ncbi:Protein transport protein TIP20 [Nakaseomyces bracarensis]|uniref:Protein transport protein TIP20 n=1 Tax=Nakaseomyces bracarensis TaxID=273131 RepID=A0ABR4NZS6_9SACH